MKLNKNYYYTNDDNTINIHRKNGTTVGFIMLVNNHIMSLDHSDILGVPSYTTLSDEDIKTIMEFIENTKDLLEL
jgi:hypothetical protein